MQDLTSANIEIIIAEVSKANISFSHLRDELIDHICCEVENEMQNGISFENAFEKVKKIIGNKGLKKVQENTLFLIDKKYRFMKRTMKIFGLTSLLMITVGALFKIQHWPGAGPLMVLGFFLLGAIFFPSALWVMKKESKLKGSLFIYLISIIGGILFIFGILFKIQHYPGANLLLLIGFSTIGLVLIPAILISKLRDENARNLHSAYIIGAISLIIYLAGTLFKIMTFPGAAPLLFIGAIGLTMVFFLIYVMKVYKNAESIKVSFLFLCIGILFFNMFSLLLALNISKGVLAFFIKPGTEITKTASILENKSNSLSEEILVDSLISDTLYKKNIIRVKTLSDELNNFIEDIKIELISKVDGIDNTEAKVKIKNPLLINSKDNYDIPMSILLGNTEDGKSGKASQIKIKIESLKDSLMSYCSGDENAVTIIKKSLSTESPIHYTDKGLPFVNWEISNFYRVIAISALNKLCFFQRNVRIAELETLESLNSGYLANNQKSIIKTN